jgi:hypothetical protein
MAPESEIAAIEERRLAELEKQAALYGPQTDPAVLIEIADLRRKYARQAPNATVADRRSNATLDMEFVMSMIAAALQRITVIESLVLNDQAKRPLHQAINMAWMTAITLLLIYALFR